jgi:hypothetical protein
VSHFIKGMLSFTFSHCYAEWHYVKCRYAAYHYTESRGAISDDVRHSKSCLGQVFNFNLGRFDAKKEIDSVHARAMLELQT